jgi:long-chain fatty acid transport protein
MKFQKTILALSLSAISVHSHSAAFQLNETSASGLGRAFAGDAVIADDAAVLARNPAAMALFKAKSLSVAATYVDPGVDVKGAGAPDLIDSINGGNFDLSKLDEDGVVPGAVIPGFYFINPINDKFAFGFGMNSNFGLSTDYPDSYPAGSIAGGTELTTVNFNASGSYRLNEQLSFGLGLNVVYGDAVLTRHAGDTGAALAASQGRVLPANTELIKMEGDDISFGWNVGAVYEVNADHRFGLTYRSEVAVDFEGDYTAVGSPTVAGNLAIDMPWGAEFSGFHQLNKQWAVHYSVMYTNWESFEKMEAFTSGPDPVFAKDENYESTYRFALGTTYTHSDNLTLRAGIAHDESAAVDAFRSISIPDSDRLWYSAGATYKISDSDSIDFGFAYVDGDKVTLHEEDAVLADVPPALVGADKDWHFESEGNAILLSVQYNKSF